MLGYCLRCKKKNEIAGAITKNMTTKKGMVLITQGLCSVCNGKIAVINKEKKA